VLNSGKRVGIASGCILATAGFISLYGIYQAYAGADRIWWFSGYGGDVRGTYINRNHFAGLMGMALMLATGYASSLIGGFHRRKEDQSRTMNDKVLSFLRLEKNISKRALVVFGGVIAGLGLVLSASRGGIISAALGLLVLGIFYVTRKSQKRNGLIVLVVFVLVAGYGFNAGLEHTIERFQSDQLQSSFEGRYRYAMKTMDVFRDYKAAGVGVGNFQYAYPRYQAPEDMGLLIDYAHNDWAQFLAEAGMTGFAVILFGLGYFVFHLVRLWLHRRDPHALAMGVVPLAVLTTMGVHSFFDFNMHIPANVLILAAILAIGQAALSIRIVQTGEKFDLQFRRVYLQGRGSIYVALIVLFLVWSTGWTLRHFVAETYCNTVPNSTLVRDQNPAAAEVQQAIGWDRYNADYRHKLARGVAREQGEGDTGEYLLKMTQVLEEAVRLNPFAPLYYLELGWAYTRRWQEPDFNEKWLSQADHAMDMAGLYSGARDARLHIDLGNYWLKRSKTLGPSSAAWNEALQKAGRHYTRAVDLAKKGQQRKMLQDIQKTVMNYYPDPEMWERLKGSRIQGSEGSRGKAKYKEP
jgi:O-antigen ligase